MELSKINQQLKKNIEIKFIEKPVNYIENTKTDISLMKKYLNIKPFSLDEGLKLYMKKINQ